MPNPTRASFSQRAQILTSSGPRTETLRAGPHPQNRHLSTAATARTTATGRALTTTGAGRGAGGAGPKDTHSASTTELAEEAFEESSGLLGRGGAGREGVCELLVTGHDLATCSPER